MTPSPTSGTLSSINSSTSSMRRTNSIIAILLAINALSCLCRPAVWFGRESYVPVPNIHIFGGTATTIEWIECDAGARRPRNHREIGQIASC